MKVLRALLVTVVTLAVLTATAYAAGYALHEYGGQRGRGRLRHPAAPSPTTGPSATPTPSATPAPPTPTPDAHRRSPSPRTSSSPAPAASRSGSCSRGCSSSRGSPRPPPGAYDAATRDGGQRLPGQARPARHRRRRPAHLEAARGDDRAARRTTSCSTCCTPGRRSSRRAPAATQVRDLQARLVAIEWLFGDVTGTYDATTTEAVRGFQAKRGIPVTGEVDQRTLDRLHAMTRTPTREAMHNLATPGGTGGHARPALPDRPGRCASTSPASTLRWVVDGKVLRTVDVRFGSDELPTREGVFTRLLEEPRPRVEPLRHLDAVRDVLLRRPGRALLPRLRGQRLQRRLARVRERPRLRRRSPGSSTRCRSATRCRLLVADRSRPGARRSAYADSS